MIIRKSREKTFNWPIEPDILGVLQRNMTERASWEIRTGVLELKMFHEVKIFDKNGKMKKVLSSKKLSKNYWNSFFQMGEPIRNKGKKGDQQSTKIINFDDENLSSET